MPIRPDELELKIGDRVTWRYTYPRNLGWGTCTGYEGKLFMVVRWDSAPEIITPYLRAHLVRVCNNCDLPYADHAEGEKCLYGPTNWS